jgi:hypothetical protein
VALERTVGTPTCPTKPSPAAKPFRTSGEVGNVKDLAAFVARKRCGRHSARGGGFAEPRGIQD